MHLDRSAVLRAPTVDAQISPVGAMDILSRAEQARLLDHSQGGLHEVFRRCALAVLASGQAQDDSRALLERYPDFDLSVVQRERGIKIDLRGAPADAFVDGRIIRGIQEHLYAVLRDVLFISGELQQSDQFDLDTAAGTTDAVFHVLRNAGVLRSSIDPNLVVCWGGHSIGTTEYEYTKKVGYALGLRALDICTGCGPGAMKGPMKGAAIAHAKQRGTTGDQSGGRYYGFTEPGIIAAESPNPICNHLVILPDIEKRLEAFVRCAHGIVVFPGGVGTAEEILYILGILMHPDNADEPLPLVFTGPAESAAYFERIDAFIGATLGDAARARYRIVVDDPVEVARAMQSGIARVREHRKASADAYYFNWRLRIDRPFQLPFSPTHQAMAALRLQRDQAPHELAAQLRRAFSGVVAGNVKAEGIAAVERQGPFELRGDAELMRHMDELLGSFVAQQRMKLPGTQYVPCYRIVR